MALWTNAGSLLILASLLPPDFLSGLMEPATTTNGNGFNGAKGEPPPKEETGQMTFAEWEFKYGGSYLDYEDWLKGV